MKQKRILAILCYFTIIGWIYSLIKASQQEKRNAHTVFHLQQSLFIYVILILYNIFFMGSKFLVPLNTLVWLGITTLWLMGLFSAYQGTVKPLRLLYGFKLLNQIRADKRPKENSSERPLQNYTPREDPQYSPPKLAVKLDPVCDRCKRPLEKDEYLESPFGLNEFEKNLKQTTGGLYLGTVCKRCQKVECHACRGSIGKPCTNCGGRVDPAFVSYFE